MNNINTLITELVKYGTENGLVDEADKVYVTNTLLETLGLSDYEEDADALKSSTRSIQSILDDILDYAKDNEICELDTVTQRDLFDTKLMGCITPLPSVVRAKFNEKLAHSTKEATDFYYSFSKATNYIRTERVAKDEKWVTATEYGDIDITINLSKPEKDPRDIAAAGKAKASGYPKCLLCKENEGYAGHISHPARQNHRVIPIKLSGDDYFLQYSPYVYYNEHCIIFNDKHIPMVINKNTLSKLISFVGQYQHYTAGSNADLPIVGGSILSHDHFQGGAYTFAMARADYEYKFEMKGFPEVEAGIIKWPLSVIRLKSASAEAITEAADKILGLWRKYTDEDAFILAETDGVPHNTITPIARFEDGRYILDLALRNNITTEEHPMGVYHPHAEYHHIKKENIGLIEVMGLAILPARLKKEMEALEAHILAGKDISLLKDDEALGKHADWVTEWITKYDADTLKNPEKLHKAVQNEIGLVFSKVLECAGVYKRDEAGMAAFRRFTDSLNA
ncbi:MAG: UDP-glucose--hexose-1-phosphate uridylyltransferase [Eubacterium sp.]|nr:UDP-glucose--hexose-1-phosphate uridylyltransferase [Eubacterium sp.]